MSVDLKLIVGMLFLLLFSNAAAMAAPPNIVVILTDDQDNTGSMAHMPKVLSLIAEHGITFDNSFVNFSLGWASFKNDEANTLPVWLKSAGRTTALLGKYVNGYGKGKVPRQSWASALGRWMDLGGTDASNQDPRTYVPPGLAPDGRSLSPLFVDAGAPWRSALLIEGGDDQSTRAPRYTAVRTATKKYIRRKDGSEGLFDLAADPYELEDKAGDPSYAGDLANLRSIQEGLKSCAGENCWVP